MSKIQAELMEALKLKDKKGESREGLLKRIYAATQEVTDQEFDDLPGKGQTWANNCSKDVDAAKPLRDFPDYTPEAAEAEESETDVKPKTEKKAQAKAAAKTEAKAEKPAKEKKAKAEGKRGPRGSGIIDAIFAHTLKNPNDDGDAIVAALKEDGVEASKATAASCSAFFKKTVRFLQSKKLTTKTIFAD
jgi:hypothetical protein